jgi:hypothetical protein
MKLKQRCEFLSKWCPWPSRDKKFSPLPALQPTHVASRLSQLPVEMLLLIVDHLPPESAAALGLTSRIFVHLVPHARSQLHDNVPATRRLLLLLEEDQPNYTSCYDCNKLYECVDTNGYPATNIHAQRDSSTRVPRIQARLASVVGLMVSRIFHEKFATLFSGPTGEAQITAFLFLTSHMNASCPSSTMMRGPRSPSGCAPRSLPGHWSFGDSRSSTLIYHLIC